MGENEKIEKPNFFGNEPIQQFGDWFFREQHQHKHSSFPAQRTSRFGSANSGAD